jgi:cyclic pyranopterin phosphate synthase
MPEPKYAWLPRASLLTFEEIDRLATIFTSLGVDKIRITGGEPLLRRDLPSLVVLLANNTALTDLAMTTNGVLLAHSAARLNAAGLRRVTVSLDTLRPDCFRAFSRGAKLADVMKGLDALQDAGFVGTKINAVITRGANDDEILDLFEFASARRIEVRYIEYMDVGGATEWSIAKVVSQREIVNTFRAEFGTVEAVADDGDPSAPVERFRLPDGRQFGVIASMTAPFCRRCDRSRITADGMYLRCLYADAGFDLRKLLRDGAADEEIAGLIADAWRDRADRGAEERLATPSRGPLYPISGLRSNPHREMHTRGG